MSRTVSAVLKSVLALSRDEQRILVETVKEKWDEQDDLGLDPEFVKRFSVDRPILMPEKIKGRPWQEFRRELWAELDQKKKNPRTRKTTSASQRK